MSKRIKMIVETGYASCDHIDYMDLPENWDVMSEKEREKFLDELAVEFLHENCSCNAFVEDEEDE